MKYCKNGPTGKFDFDGIYRHDNGAAVETRPLLTTSTLYYAYTLNGRAAPAFLNPAESAIGPTALFAPLRTDRNFSPCHL
jgi:hypothetical protein